MGTGTKVAMTVVGAVIAYAAIQSAFQSPGGPPGNSIRPNVATFTVKFRPDKDHGGTPGVAISWSAGVLDGSPIAYTSPWIHSVAVLDGNLLDLEAIPANPPGHITAEWECWIHLGGKVLRHAGPSTAVRGCSLQAVATIP